MNSLTLCNSQFVVGQLKVMLDGHSATLWQGAIYIWGGKDEQHATAQRAGATYFSNAMFVLDPIAASESTTGTAAMERIFVPSGTGGQNVVPKGRAYHTASTYGKHLFIVGGLVDESDMSATDGVAGVASNSNVNLPVFDLERRIWSQKTTFGDIPCARCHHVAAVYGDTLFVHGGYPVISNTGKEVSAEEMASMQHAMYDVHELNLTTLRWRRVQNSQSPALWGHSAIVYNRNVIVFGGVDVVENAETGAVAVWHQEKKVWRWADFHDLDLRCAMHVAAVEGTRMIVYGGVSFRSKGKLRSLYEFNLEFGTWKELQPRGNVPLGRIGHAAVAVQQQLFVIGGAVDAPGGGGLQAGKPERCLHIYSVPQNEWRTLQLVTTVGGGADGEEGVKSGPTAQRKTDTTWAVNTTLTDGSNAEWDDTAAHVRETISRAKAIQHLADSASAALQTGSAHQPQRASSPAGLTKTPAGTSGSPFDDTRRRTQTMDKVSSAKDGQRHELTQGGRAANVTSQTELNPAQQQLDRILELRGGVQSEDARRLIEHLQSENMKLRKTLDEYRSSSSAAAGSNRNPYEVPIFNSAMMTSAILPENDVPPQLRGMGGAGEGSRLEGGRVIADFAPRLNINVAEPPRALGQQSGYMTRAAVSALVNNAINRGSDGTPASSTLATNLRAAQSLDPMAYLTPAPSVAAAMSALYGGNTSGAGLGAVLSSGQNQQQTSGAGSFQPAQSYEQLLARSGMHSVNGQQTQQQQQGGGGMQDVPLSLQPLLSMLTGGGIGGGGSNSFFQHQQQQQPQMQQQQTFQPQPTFNSNMSINMTSIGSSPHQNNASSNGGQMAGPSAGGGNSGMNASFDPNKRFKSPSLSSVVHGQNSMLSLGFLQRAK